MLTWTGLSFRARPANIDETKLPGELPEDYVMRLAVCKAEASIPYVKSGEIILSADTIVVDGNLIIGKPQDAGDAVKILQTLRGRTHSVLTAIVMYDPENSVMHKDICESPVKMRNYYESEIEQYVASGDPMDKAGAYAIQHPVFNPVETFTDCFASVMGFPLCHFVRLMDVFGIKIPNDLPNTCQTQLQYLCPVFDLILNKKDSPVAS